MTGMDELIPLIDELARRLTDRRWSCSTAESCTGGGIAWALTGLAGSSGWFDRGFVVYSNESKREMLGVSADTLREHGAVSSETAVEMAEGALAHSRAQAAMAVTGIAGPGGATVDKPVGTVVFAWALTGLPTTARTHRLGGDRGSVRSSAVNLAIEGLLERLNEG